MLISRRSPKKSKLFQSRFKDGSGVDFPLRQYLRCREDLMSGSLHLVLLVAFTVTVGFFGPTVNEIFERHGGDLPGGLRWTALAMVAAFVLLLVRRVVNRGRELRETWQEMRRLQSELRRRPDSRPLDEAAGTRGDPAADDRRS
ncbi:MAG: hypothetical protein R6X25_01325 [Candidatus Krumholzibacteriia bacterium]